MICEYIEAAETSTIIGKVFFKEAEDYIKVDSILVQDTKLVLERIWKKVKRYKRYTIFQSL